MATSDGEGTLYISMEEYSKWLLAHLPVASEAAVWFGPPRADDEDFAVNFAWSTHDTHPSEFATPTKVAQQWEERKRMAAKAKLLDEIMELAEAEPDARAFQSRVLKALIIKP